MKVAAAPISWGVSELPAWGLRMSPERVLAEMRAAGFEATELGPPGYLPDDPQACRDLLERHGLRLAAGFLATSLHESTALGEVEKEAGTLAAAGGEMLVLAASVSGASYDGHLDLSSEAWLALGKNLAAAANIATAYGLGVSFHPHVGTAIENQAQVAKLLATTDIGLCLDTGHLLLGGIDPVQLAAEAGPRINHVHLKDMNLEIAARVRARNLTYADAVRKGLYRPLGQGGVEIEAVLRRLRDVGYEGWFVLEQDTALQLEPEPASGPVTAAGQSLTYFRRVSGVEAIVEGEQ
jgi:inosose dehydratase